MAKIIPRVVINGPEGRKKIIEGVNNSLPVTQDFTMITEEK